LEHALSEVRDTSQAYALNDIYNFDEAALFWKQSPDLTLAPEEQFGAKKEKARLSAGLCVNTSCYDPYLDVQVSTLVRWFISDQV